MKGLKGRVVFSADFLATLDHTSRALKSESFITDPTPQGRGRLTSEMLKESAAIIGNAASSVSGRIIPGFREGAISPLSQSPDEETTRNLYQRVVSAATRKYPRLSPEEAVKKFSDMGWHLKEYRGVFSRGRGRSTSGTVTDKGVVIISPGGRK